MAFVIRLLVIATLFACSSPKQAPADATGDSTPDGSTVHKPNFVFILTDDLDDGVYNKMPRLKTLLDDAGTRFTRHHLNIALCCPSRTAILRGQYAHNTKIFSNAPPNGGFETFFKDGSEADTLPVWLAAAGYRTTLVGKYLNGYPNTAPALYKPPGWTEWVSPVDGNPYSEYNYDLNDNGVLVPHAGTPDDYMVDLIAAKSVDFIQRAASDHTPFFMYITPYAPHSPATPADAYANDFVGAKAPRTPSFNEADVSDKPAWLSGQPLLTATQLDHIDALYRKRLQSMESVEDLVQRVVDTLTATGQLENTYIVFTSDNGFHQGQHRLNSGKQTAFDEDLLVPLVVRGPGVPAGVTVDYPTVNVDFAPTFLELAGAAIPAGVDGRSLRALLGGAPPDRATWRQLVLLEHGEDSGAELQQVRAPIGTLEPLDDPSGAAEDSQKPPPFEGIRTARYTYVEYPGGERELYDHQTDPDQLTNIAGTPAAVDVLGQLATTLHSLHACQGEGCRAAEQAATP